MNYIEDDEVILVNVGADRLYQVLILLWESLFGAEEENHIHWQFLQDHCFLHDGFFNKDVGNHIICVFLTIFEIYSAEANHLFPFVGALNTIILTLWDRININYSKMKSLRKSNWPMSYTHSYLQGIVSFSFVFWTSYFFSLLISFLWNCGILMFGRAEYLL
mgnify:CR=1 FL=1